MKMLRVIVKEGLLLKRNIPHNSYTLVDKAGVLRKDEFAGELDYGTELYMLEGPEALSSFRYRAKVLLPGRLEEAPVEFTFMGLHVQVVDTPPLVLLAREAEDDELSGS